MTLENISELKEEGYTIIRNVISENWINRLIDPINKAFLEHQSKQLKLNNEISSYGVALHVLLSNDIFIDLLDHLLHDTDIISMLSTEFFKANCILNSFSALNNLKIKGNFSANVHRDLRFYSGNFPVMVNCLVMVDDFTIENGGTYLLPKSHLHPDKPSDEFFFKNAIQATGKSGDILIFNSNVWHASAPNLTDKSRVALPITISRSFLKQLVDYPRAIGYDQIFQFDSKLQQFLGYHSRVPASLEEWYQPEEKRFYKKDQD